LAISALMAYYVFRDGGDSTVMDSLTGTMHSTTA